MAAANKKNNLDSNFNKFYEYASMCTQDLTKNIYSIFSAKGHTLEAT